MPAQAGTLCLDLLSRQAEGRLLLAGQEMVMQRASAAGLSPEQLESTEVQALLQMLGRGPASPEERSLFVALALRGLDAALEAEPSEALPRRFVSHAAWLEIATPYQVFALVDRLLPPGSAERLWAAAGQIVQASVGPGPKTRALAAALLEAMSAAERGRPALRQLLQTLSDPALVALGARLLGEEASDEASRRHSITVEGRAGSPPRSGLLGMARLVTGLSALGWLLGGLLWLLGLRHRLRAELVEGGLRLHREVSIFGRSIRESSELFTLAAIASAGRTVRYPALLQLVGALASSIGLLVGGLWLFEGVLSGETFLLLVSAAAILLGGGLDLALGTLLPGRRAEVGFDLGLLPRRRVRMRGVPLAEVDRFLAALEERIAARAKT